MNRKPGKRMQRAIDAAPFTYTKWGFRIMGGLPDGVTEAALDKCLERGLLIASTPEAFTVLIEKAKP